jgi:hypothetical protein
MKRKLEMGSDYDESGGEEMYGKKYNYYEMPVSPLNRSPTMLGGGSNMSINKKMSSEE